jgi:L-alanine-DL-glutamate epimerase-like enolase superfamily enzyme
MPHLTVKTETWPLARAFAISRGSKTSAELVVATVVEDGVTGRGECVPYARYGESVEGVVDCLRALAPDMAAGMTREALQQMLPAGAARNALDCALWDFEAKKTGTPVWRLAGLPEPGPVTTAFTLGLDSPDAMGRAARAESHRPLIKIKLAGEGDIERVAAIREAAPDARLIVDANEGWAANMVGPLGAALAGFGVEMIEQPLPAGADGLLADLPHAVPFYADESCHDRASLESIVGKYDGVNIKLDKTGGLTEALILKREAEAAGLGVMIGCMVATSLAMAPALLLARDAAIVDLDGPLLLAGDRDGGLEYAESELFPPCVALWG